tara:strand:- start:19758 stop:20627 length:870 start_codon:yes stop_codon:yes gene_type:complete
VIHWIKLWLLAARPKTLSASITPVLMGTSLACIDGFFHWLAAGSAMVAALLIQIGTNFANDYFDFQKGADTQERLGPIRMVQSGAISPEAMKKVMFITFALALIPGFYLLFRGGFPILIIGLSSIILGYLYTGGPKPLGYLGLGDFLVLIYFGPVAVGGTYFVQTLEINSVVLLSGLAPGFLSVALLAVNNLRDADTDAEAGKKTLAVKFGKTFTKFEYLISIVIAGGIPFFIQPSGRPWFASLVCIFTLPAIMKIFREEDSTELIKALEITGKVMLFYGFAFSLGVLL